MLLLMRRGSKKSSFGSHVKEYHVILNFLWDIYLTIFTKLGTIFIIVSIKIFLPWHVYSVRMSLKRLTKFIIL